MGLDRDLLDQAALLLSADKTKPKQVNLRRAISAAYYAVFHLLVREATNRVVGQQTHGKVADALRVRVSRWYEHGQMKRVCLWFSADGKIPSDVIKLLEYSPPPGIVPNSLAALAGAFVKLQEERHNADYDVSYAPTKFEAELLVLQAELALVDVSSLSGDPVYNLFLGMLLTGDKAIITR